MLRKTAIMPVSNAPAMLPPSHRAVSHAHVPIHGPAHGRTARRLSADGNRRPVTERCGHHPAGTPGAVPLAAANGASLWRTMMERWLATAP